MASLNDWTNATQPHTDAPTLEFVTLPDLSDPSSSALSVHYGLALIKGKRFEWALQKMTELGVTHITPLITERSEVKLSGVRLDKKMTQRRNELIAALKQSHRVYLPHLSPPQSLSDWLAEITKTCQQRWILCPHSTAKLDPLTTLREPHTPLAIASGPEGGFSPHEIDSAQALGFTPLRLGPRVLRAETAPLVALTLAQSHAEAWC